MTVVVLGLVIVSIVVIAAAVVGAFTLARHRWRTYRVRQELRQIEQDAYRQHRGSRRL